MSTIGFDPAAFRVLFPAFANTTTYTDATLTAYFNAAGNFVTTVTGGAGVNAQQQSYILSLMTAHIAALASAAASGASGGIVTSSTIDKISVSLLAPPAKSQFSWWLNQTPYGAQLAALLAVVSVTGFYAGGRPEVPALRRGCYRWR